MEENEDEKKQAIDIDFTEQKPILKWWIAIDYWWSDVQKEDEEDMD